MTQARFNFTPRKTFVAALLLAATAASHAAGGGEALDIELPSMRTPVQSPAPLAVPEITLASTSETTLVAMADTKLVKMTDAAVTATLTAPVRDASSAPAELLTRDQVQEELRQAREAGTLSMNGELGDSDTVLAARDSFNAAQAEAILAAYRAEDERIAALLEAERLRAEAEAAQLALATGKEPDAQLSLEFVGGDSE